MGDISKTAHFRTLILGLRQGLRLLSLHAKASVWGSQSNVKNAILWSDLAIFEDVRSITHFSHAVFMTFLTYFI